MRVLGIRTSTKEIRFAILDFADDGTVLFVNEDGENRLKFPASKKSLPQMLWWLHQELERVVRQNLPVDKIMVKSNEYVGGNTKASREAAYIEGVVYVFAGQNDIHVDSKIYRSMKTCRQSVKAFAEEIIGKTQKNWNEQMADAVAVAYVGGAH